MTVQMTGTSVVCTMVLLNVVMALSATPPMMHMRSPVPKSTMRVSYFLMIATNARTTIIPPAIANEKTSLEVKPRNSRRQRDDCLY